MYSQIYTIPAKKKIRVIPKSSGVSKKKHYTPKIEFLKKDVIVMSLHESTANTGGDCCDVFFQYSNSVRKFGKLLLFGSILCVNSILKAQKRTHVNDFLVYYYPGISEHQTSRFAWSNLECRLLVIVRIDFFCGRNFEAFLPKFKLLKLGEKLPILIMFLSF